MLILFNAANAMFLAFFESLLTLDAWRLLDQVGGAATSIQALITHELLTVHLAAPLVLLGMALQGTVFARARRVTRLTPLVLASAGVLLFIHARLTEELFLRDEHNGVLHVSRQAAERVYQLHAEKQATRKQHILESLTRTYNLPPSDVWRVGTDMDHPLLQVPVAPTTRAGRPLNVVLVLMESVRLAETGIGRDGAPLLTPNLDALARAGVYYPRFYANAYQTVRGEMTTLCSTIPNYGRGQEYSSRPDLALACLPQILASHGYQTHWISAYSANYGNKRAFLGKHGVQHFHDREEIKQRPLKKPSVGWGASDEDLAEFAVDVLDRARPPFFAEVMTLSNHHPFNHDYGVEPPPHVTASPERGAYKNYLRGTHYTDVAVGHLMALARQRPWFKDTLFIFLGDHGAWVFPEQGARALTVAEKIEVYHRTPLIMYAPAQLQPRVDVTLGSQVDVAPTVLELLGIRARNAFQGTSLLQPLPHKDRTVVMGNDSAWNVRQGDRYCMALGQSCFRHMHPRCPDGFKPKMRGYACFEEERDLLDLLGDSGAAHMLGDREGAALTARARRMVENHGYLMLHDALFPR